jgi:hypothetical protein
MYSPVKEYSIAWDTNSLPLILRENSATAVAETFLFIVAKTM